MNKSILIWSVFLLLSTFSFAQDKGNIALSIGSAFPTGDFAISDINNPKAGIAKTGITYDLSFAYKLGKNFGLSAMLRGQSNAIDDQAFLTLFETGIPTAKWTVESTAWMATRIMFGGSSSVPIGQGKTSFEARGLVGIIHASSPDLTISGLQSGITEWINQSSVTANTFTYLIGAGFKFNVGAKVCLLTNLDYTGGTPEFKNVVVTSSFSSSTMNTYSQNMGTINLSIGIGMRL